MKFSTSSPKLSSLKTDVLALGFGNDEFFSDLGHEIDRKLSGRIKEIIKKEKFHGTVGETRLVDTHGKIGAGTIVLVGLGDERRMDLDLLRKFAAWAVKSANRIKEQKVTVEELPAARKIAADQRGQALTEGALMANYRFDVYKSKKTNSNDRVSQFEILTSDSQAVNRGIRRGVAYGESVNFARDLVNTPASDMTPRIMAEAARKIARSPGLFIQVHDKRQIKKMGMGCYLAVSKGSTEPPYLVHLRYRPAGTSKKRRKVIAVVGKGVTFDSGGLSLKSASSMETMKDDMSGAAAMMGVMKALAVLKPGIEVHGISALTENMPSGSAEKPGDIARAMSGKTVEILNTDAEGRLTLADAVFYAQKFKPDVLIDIATLTGACVMALGELCTGIMGNHQELIDELVNCGKAAGEKIWPFPLIDEYRDEIKSSIADLKNVGGRFGGTINGALFIQEFIDPKIPWAHLDIAGPSWTDKELPYCPRGGTGHSVRTLLNYLLKQ